MANKILVFIPAYNCSKQINRVLGQFDKKTQQSVDTVMVVDNQSVDGTLEEAMECAKQRMKWCNFIAWRNNNNYGLGGSHKAAFRYAIDHGFDFMVVLHGDDQADIKDLMPLLEENLHQRADCLLGARFMSASKLKGYSWFRTIGNKVYNVLFSLVIKRRIYDLGSGLNLYKLESFKEFYYEKFPDDLTFNYVMLLASYHKQQNADFFPISWREDDQVSNVKLFSQAFKVLRLLASFALSRNKFLSRELRKKTFPSYDGEVLFKSTSV